MSILTSHYDKAVLLQRIHSLEKRLARAENLATTWRHSRHSLEHHFGNSLREALEAE